MKSFKKWLAVLLACALAVCMLTSCSSGGNNAGSGSGGGSAVDPTVQAYREEVLRLVNIEREKAGVDPLTMDDDNLTAAAQLRATELPTLFSHTRPDGSSCFTALSEYNVSYRTCGENIAAGQSSPEAVMNWWMNSSGHKANILNAKFKKIGIGYCYSSSSDYGYYWVQMFTN